MRTPRVTIATVYTAAVHLGPQTAGRVYAPLGVPANTRARMLCTASRLSHACTTKPLAKYVEAEDADTEEWRNEEGKGGRGVVGEDRKRDELGAEIRSEGKA